MTLMNRTNNYGSRRNVYRSNPSYTDDSRSMYSRNAPANSYTNTPTNSYKVETTNHYSSGGVDIPQAFVDDETGYNAGMRRNAALAASRKGGRSWMVSFGILMAICLVGGYSLISYQERKFMKAQLADQDASMRELEIDLSMKFDAKIKNLKDENASLQRKLSEGKDFKITNQNLKERNKSLEKQLNHAKEEIKSNMRKNEIAVKSKATLHNNIQRMSKEAVIAQYGKGPHRLEIYLRFDSHLGRDDGGAITIELAPLEELPHAVHWFLEQVDRKLYDGFSFHRNAGHVIQAGAHRNFLTNSDKPPSEQKFKDVGYHSLLFQEYSHKFPHRKYTLGFAGRPGGPSFYISTKDNTKIHGPGGQQNYDDPTEADTCFAKVVDGFDLVDRMVKLPVKDGSYKSLKDNVAIVSIRRKIKM